jgi:hypothetical protein
MSTSLMSTSRMSVGETITDIMNNATEGNSK